MLPLLPGYRFWNKFHDSKRLFLVSLLPGPNPAGTDLDSLSFFFGYKQTLLLLGARPQASTPEVLKQTRTRSTDHWNWRVKADQRLGRVVDTWTLISAFQLTVHTTCTTIVILLEVP